MKTAQPVGSKPEFGYHPAMPFERELAFFIAHQDELVAKHQGKTLVLRGEQVEGAYDSNLAAFIAAQSRFPVGTFMIQPCQAGPSAYTVTLHSLRA
jgi:hypothetical protein